MAGSGEAGADADAADSGWLVLEMVRLRLLGVRSASGRSAPRPLRRAGLAGAANAALAELAVARRPLPPLRSLLCTVERVSAAVSLAGAAEAARPRLPRPLPVRDSSSAVGESLNL